MTVTTKPTAAMCLGHFAALVLRATEILGLAILIAVVVSVRHAHLNTAVAVGNVVMKRGSQSASMYFRLVSYDMDARSHEYTFCDEKKLLNITC